MRRTLTIDDDVDCLLERENRSTGEPMKQTVNRILRAGLHQVAHPPTAKRFTVKPLNTGLTKDQWQKWEGMKIEDILEQTERPVSR